MPLTRNGGAKVYNCWKIAKSFLYKSLKYANFVAGNR